MDSDMQWLALRMIPFSNNRHQRETMHGDKTRGDIIGFNFALEMSPENDIVMTPPTDDFEVSFVIDTMRSLVKSFMNPIPRNALFVCKEDIQIVQIVACDAQISVGDNCKQWTMYLQLEQTTRS